MYGMLPRQLHMLQSIKETGKLGVYHKGRTYVVSFVNSKDALDTARKIGKTCKVYIQEYNPVEAIITDGYVELSFETPCMFTVNKDITPQWEWMIETIEIEQLLQLPITNTGVIVTNKKVTEDIDSLTFECYVIEPIQDLHFFRMSLQNMTI